MSPQAIPRALVGRDLGSCRYPHRSRCFNPRAAWGATRNGSTVTQPSSFQSARPRGARLGAFVQSIQDAKFQSMRPRGARQSDPDYDQRIWEFQSTRPRGARPSPSWTNTNYSTKQSYIQVATRLTKITRPAVPQFRCQGTRANIPANRHHLPFARHRARQLAEPQGHKVSLHQNAQPFFANSSRGYTRAGYLLTHQ